MDGHWQTDYHADGTADNQYGTHNSIVHAELPAPQPGEEFHSSLVRERSGLTNPRTSRPLPSLVKHPVLDPGSVYAGRSQWRRSLHRRWPCHLQASMWRNW
ncbi:MAG: hypothetical protein R2851_17135 [Caldilineaceae bacterium]